MKQYHEGPKLVVLIKRTELDVGRSAFTFNLGSDEPADDIGRRFAEEWIRLRKQFYPDES